MNNKFSQIIYRCLLFLALLLSFQCIGYAAAFNVEDDKNVVLKRKLLSNLPESAQGTTYIVRSTLNLRGSTLNMPQGCALLFEKGKIKNGQVVFHDNKLDGKVKIQCDFDGTIINDTVYTDWFLEGKKSANKVFDASGKVQKVFDLGSRNIIFGKGYYQFANTSIGSDIVIEGEGTVIVPMVLDQDEYHFNFLKNVFYAKDANTVVVKNICFQGRLTGTILTTFKSATIFGEPLIWVDNADRVVIDGCVFKDIENCTYCNKAYNYYGKKQGSCVCLWDVTDASYINCEQVNCRHDEQIWIIAVNKPIMDTKVTVTGNYVHDMTPGPNSSAFTCVAGECLVEKNRVERYNYPGSMFNFFAKRLTIRNNIIEECYCSSVFDACEYGYFHNDIINVYDNQVEAYNSILLASQSEKVTIKNNTFHGLTLYCSTNKRVPSNKYKNWYTEDGGILPVDAETVIESNKADLTHYDGTRSIAGTQVNYGTGEILAPQKYNSVGNNYGCGILIHPINAKAGNIIIVNNEFTSIESLDGERDDNNLQGVYPHTIRLINTDKCTIRGNTFNGAYPTYNSPETFTCISVYNYPDVMERLEKPTGLSRKPLEYGTYIIEDNTFNINPSIKIFVPVAVYARTNALRQTEIRINELVVKNNKFGGIDTKATDVKSFTAGKLFKANGPVRVIKETVR